MISVNYIVVFYSGKRRSYPNGTPVINFLNEHIKYIETQPKNINACSFIINKGELDIDNRLIDIINDFSLRSNIPVNLLVRDNIYGSYGAWEDTIINSYKNFTHSFLIEDDYISNVNDIITPFLEEMNLGNAKFTASLYKNNCASISNGLLDNSIVEDTIKKYSKLFMLEKDKEYGGFGSCQLTFLKFIDGKFNDITDKYNTIFLDLNKEIVYGNPKGITLIKPIKK